ncbi:MAG: hydrogen peroxide-inducible genes activator [Pseudomonadota bacterium]
MKRLPTLRQMTFLAALAEHGSFSRAARAAHVSQSTLSAGIKEFEDILGGQVVDRSSRQVLFTPLGTEVLRRAVDVLTAVGDIVTVAERHRAPLSGEIRLGVIPTIAPFILPRALPPLREAFPGLRLVLREDLTAVLLEQLRAGALDLVLMAYPYATDKLTTRVLGTDRFYVAGPASVPWAKERSVTLEQLGPKPPWLLLDDGHCLRDHALRACAAGPNAPIPSGRADGDLQLGATSLNTLIQMVGLGLGITLLPSMAVSDQVLAGADVITVPLEPEGVAREIGLAWRDGSAREADYHVLADFLEPFVRQAA